MASKKRKVSIYVPTLEGGGAERVMATVASSLAERGHHVDLLLVQKRGPYLEELSSLVNVVNFNKSRMLHTLGVLMKYLATQRPDAILSAMGHTNVMTLTAVRLSKYKPRVVISQRGDPHVSSLGGKSSRVQRMLGRLLYPRADAIVAVSDGVGRQMQKYYALPSSHIRTIYNPIDIADIRNSAKVAPSHPWLQGQYQVFTAVGRLTPVKDYENLLRAFSIVYRQHPMARLVILGAGPSLESLLELASELDIDAVVDFVGFQSNPYSWVMRSDVYVLSSRSEGLPNALIQALACGVKVVSTDCEHGPSEILEQGRWGRLVPVGDPEALAKEMSSAVLDPSPPDVLTRAERFAVDTVVDEYADVLAVEHRA